MNIQNAAIGLLNPNLDPLRHVVMAGWPDDKFIYGGPDHRVYVYDENGDREWQPTIEELSSDSYSESKTE